MVGAGTRKNQPLLLSNDALVANCERHQNAAVAPLAQKSEQVLADSFT